MKKIICSLVGAVGSVIVHYLGGWDYFIQTLLIFMIIDYVSGLAVAGVFHKSRKTENGKLESNACLKGLSKKMMMLSFVLIGNLLDLSIGTTYIRDGVVIAFITNELISIIENAGLMGLKIPNVISNAIDVLTQRGEKNED